jgi:hypothetical protein
MTGPHPLNQAVIAQVLYDLRNGQLRKARALGFDDQDLDALKHPATASVLANAAVSWCSVTVNRHVLRNLVRQVEEVEKEVVEVDRLLRLGASTELITRFFGLSHQEVGLRRAVIGLSGRKGRHPVLTEQQDADLWEAWSAEIRKREIAKDDETAMLAVAADLAEAMDLPIAVIWSAIQGWIAERLF